MEKDSVAESGIPLLASEPLGIGERLRNAREARGLSLAAAEHLTRIRAVFLQALEEEEFDRLPGRIYARGFLRTYAAVLGLDPEDLQDAYPGAFDVPAQPIVGTPPAEIPIRPAAPPSRAKRIATYVAVVLFVVIGVLGYIGYTQFRQFSGPVAPAPAGSPSPAARVPGLPQQPPRESGRSQPPGKTGGGPAAEPLADRLRPVPFGGVVAEVRATGTSWVRVIADGTRVFEGFVREGDRYTWRAIARLTLRVGKPSVVDILVNGQPVQPKARRKRVWEETFTPP